MGSQNTNRVLKFNSSGNMDSSGILRLEVQNGVQM